MKKLTDRELRKIEDLVNGWVSGGIGVSKEVKGLEEAKNEGALSFFGEKYGDTVRVVSVGDISKELCGGTHVDNISEIGVVKVINESSVASGIRRIEAVTSAGAADWLKRKLEDALFEYEEISGQIKGTDLEDGAPDICRAVKRARDIAAGEDAVDHAAMREYEDDLAPAFGSLREYAGRMKKKMQKAEEHEAFSAAQRSLEGLLGKPQELEGVRFVSAVIEGADMTVLKKALIYAGKKLGSGIIILGGEKDGKAALICSVSEDLFEKGFSARGIISDIAPAIKGGGGGSHGFAQAGGKDPAGLKTALEKGRQMVSGGS